MTSHVYLLTHKNLSRFKIGKANSVEKRSRKVGGDDILYARSYQIKVASSRAALLLESALLKTFNAWRMDAEDVLADGGAQDGATEWFRIECRADLLAYIIANKAILKFTSFELIAEAPRVADRSDVHARSEAARQSAKAAHLESYAWALSRKQQAQAEARALLLPSATRIFEQLVHAVSEVGLVEAAGELMLVCRFPVVERSTVLDLAEALIRLPVPEGEGALSAAGFKFHCGEDQLRFFELNRLWNRYTMASSFSITQLGDGLDMAMKFACAWDEWPLRHLQPGIPGWDVQYAGEQAPNRESHRGG